MIYYLAHTLTGRDGGSRAGADILSSMLAPDRQITVISDDRCQLPQEIDGQPVPAPRWLAPPARSGRPRPRLSPRGVASAVAGGGRSRLLRVQLEHALARKPPSLVVHNGFPVPGSTNTELLERYPNRLIVVHSSPDALDFFQRVNPSLTREWMSERLRTAGCLAFVTPEVRDAWCEVAGLRSVRTFVVPNTTREDDARAVVATSRGEVRKSLNLSEQAFIACCIGKVDTAKGQDVLVKALPAMVECEPDLVVVFVGRVTPFASHLPTEIMQMGLGAHAIFVGSRDDSYSYIRASDMLIHPSLAEGQGLVVLEAMILRTPVLATRVGGIPFAVEHGVSGWLIPPSDAEALADGFRTLAGDPILRERLAAAAEVRYWDNFSRSLHRQRVQAVVEACLAWPST